MYGYALTMDGSGNYHRITKFNSGEDAIMSLEFDPDSEYLWTECDNNCSGRMHVFSLASSGQFEELAEYDRPSSMPNYNNEGYTIAPDSLCDGGVKPVFWSDDSDDDGHVIRSDAIPCGKFIKTRRNFRRE